MAMAYLPAILHYFTHKWLILDSLYHLSWFLMTTFLILIPLSLFCVYDFPFCRLPIGMIKRHRFSKNHTRCGKQLTREHDIHRRQDTEISDLKLKWTETKTFFIIHSENSSSTSPSFFSCYYFFSFVEQRRTKIKKLIRVTKHPYGVSVCSFSSMIHTCL